MTAHQVRLLMMVIITLAVLGSSLYIIISGKYDADNQKFASGFIGTIIVFWLRPENEKSGARKSVR